MESLLAELSGRAASLEKQNRALKRFAGLTILFLVVGISAGAKIWAVGDNPVTHRAPNNREMTLGWDPNNNSGIGISIKDKHGFMRLAFGLDKNNKGILMFFDDLGIPTKTIDQ